MIHFLNEKDFIWIHYNYLDQKNQNNKRDYLVLPKYIYTSEQLDFIVNTLLKQLSSCLQKEIKFYSAVDVLVSKVCAVAIKEVGNLFACGLEVAENGSKEHTYEFYGDILRTSGQWKFGVLKKRLQ